MGQVVAQFEPLRLILLLAGCGPGTDTAIDTAAEATERGPWFPPGHAQPLPLSPCIQLPPWQSSRWGDDADQDGFVSVEHGGDDCDDRRATAHPGAPERCDPWDHDCDGSPLAPGVCSEAVEPAEAASFQWRGGRGPLANLDWLLTPAIVPAATPGVMGQITVGCYWCSALFEPISPEGMEWVGGGAVIVQPGAAPLGTWVGEEAVRLLQGDWFEHNISAMNLGDFNGDGYPDYGFSQMDGFDTGQGGLVIHLGPIDAHWCPIEGMAEGADGVWMNEFSDQSLGYSRMGGTDLDGDGLTDIVLGTSDPGLYSSNPQRVYTIPGREDGWPIEAGVWEEPFLEVDDTRCGGGRRDIEDLGVQRQLEFPTDDN